MKSFLVVVFLFLALSGSKALAQGNSTNGQAIWTNQCQGCHADNSAMSLTIIRGYISNRSPVGMSEAKALAALNAALSGTSLPPRNVVTGMNVGLNLSNTDKNDVAAFIAGVAPNAPVVSYLPIGGPQFPSTAVGSTSSQMVTISNGGTAPLVFATNNAVTLATGGDAADFRITSSTCPGMTLPVGSGTCVINVTFQPLAGASTTRTASIGLTHNAGGGSSLVPMQGVVSGSPGGTMTPPTGSANAPSSGGGGALPWATLALLALGLMASRRR